MFGRNSQPEDPQGPPSSTTQMVPQRTFKVRYHDGKEVVEEVVVCRIVRVQPTGMLQFVDIRFEGGDPVGEILVLEIPMPNMMVRKEVYQPAETSGLMVN